MRKMSARQVLELIEGAPSIHQCLLSYTHRNPLVRWLVWKRYEKIADLAAFTSEMHVYEFGCGLGIFLPTMVSNTSRVYAADLAPKAAANLCKNLDLDVTFVETTSEIPDATLDVIVAADVLEHLEDLDFYLQEFTRKTKPGGRLLISGPTENIAYRIGRLLAGVFGQKPDPHLWDIYSLRNSIVEHGFTLRRTRRLPFRLPPNLFLVYEFEKEAS